MGIWGHGNLEEDAAAEYILMLTRPLIVHIRKTVAENRLMEPDELDSIGMMVELEILACLAEGLGRDSKEGESADLGLPGPSEVEQWQVSYMRVWESYMTRVDDSKRKSDFVKRRRQTIEATFSRVIEAAKKEHG